MTTITRTVITRHRTIMRSTRGNMGNLAWDGCDEYPCAALVFDGPLTTGDELPIGCNHTMPEVTG